MKSQRERERERGKSYRKKRSSFQAPEIIVNEEGEEEEEEGLPLLCPMVLLLRRGVALLSSHCSQFAKRWN